METAIIILSTCIVILFTCNILLISLVRMQSKLITKFKNICSEYLNQYKEIDAINAKWETIEQGYKDKIKELSKQVKNTTNGK